MSYVDFKKAFHNGRRQEERTRWAAESMVSLLSEGRSNLFKYEGAASRIGRIASSNSLREITSILVQATLFSDYGITMGGLADALNSSKQTPYRHLKALDGMGLVVRKKVGKEVFHTIDLDRLLELSDVPNDGE